MKASELRDMSVEELLENSSRIGAVKKDIARISTVLRQMELNGAEA